MFDRVCSAKPQFRKTWLLQAMKPPTAGGEHLVVTNGKGRLFIQRLLPQDAEVRLATGAELYTYGGRTYPPGRDTGPAPECRIEVSPREARAVDYFLHVLTAADAETTTVESAAVETRERQTEVAVGAATIVFTTGHVGGSIESAGRQTTLAEAVVLPYGQ